MLRSGRNALLWILIAGLWVSCDEGINDYSSSAKVTGYVYRSLQDRTGVPGVQIILESDVNSDNPYLGPDRWFETDQNGYFEAAVFLGRDPDTGDWDYVADLSIQYLYNNASVGLATGGITVSPGSVFTMPPRYLSGQ